MTVHATIDIETLSTKPEAVILTIGGIKFNPFTKEKPYSDFYYRMNVNEQVDLGRDIEEDTMSWWSTQPKDVIETALSDDNRVDVKETLEALNKWLVGVDKIWCQGPVFDICILENIYRQVGLHFNWVFWNIRDSRTLFGLMPEDPRKKMNFEAHNALEDCRVQSMCVQEVYSELQLER